MHEMKKKTTAVALTAVLIAVSFGGIFMIVDEEQTDESEAIPFLIPLIVGFLFGAITGAIVWDLTHPTAQADTDLYTRQIESGKVAESIRMTLADYKNALNNYINIWRFTNEHFIRTAEIMASAKWQPDTQYNPQDVLEAAGVYLNSAFMTSNASAQISAFFQKINERLQLWNNDPTYNGWAGNKMALEWQYGSQKITSKSEFGGWLKTAAKPGSSTENKAFVSGGDMWVFGAGTATITSSTGTVINLTQGVNHLDSILAFTPGTYELQPGREYAGDMLYVIDAKAANLTPAIVMKAGTTVKLAKLWGNQIEVDGSRYNNLNINIVPDGGNPVSEPLHDAAHPENSALVKFQAMHTTVNQTIVAANNAAGTVWNIFDRAGESSMFLTTLMVPNYYESIHINQAQRELVTTLAMIQLADFAARHESAITADDFQLSGGSFQLFMRGDLLDSNGNILFSDVIYTPFYFVNSTTVTTGNNNVNQPVIAAVWTAANGQTLSSWNFTATTRVATLVPLTGGESMNVYEILYDGNFVNSVFLDVRQIEIIDSEDFPIYIPPRLVLDGDKDWVTLVAIILIIIGALAAVTVFIHRNVIIVIGGVICIVIGVVVMVFKDSFFGGLLF